MTLSQSTSVGCLVLNMTCGKLAKDLQREIQHWISKNGPEWTCVRLKAFWSAALNIRDGHPEKAKKLYQDNSISYRKDTMLPKGPWGVLIRQFVESKRPSVMRRKAAALRFYCSLALPRGSRITQRQARKVLPAIADPEQCSFERKGLGPGYELAYLPEYSCRDTKVITPYHLPIQAKTAAALAARSSLILSDSLSREKPVITQVSPGALLDCCVAVLKDRIKHTGYEPSPVKPSEDGADRLRAMSYYYSPVQAPKGFTTLPYGHMVLSLNSTEFVPVSLDSRTRCYEMRQELRDKGLLDPVVGRIGVIQEQGMKPRVVAQPNAWTQLALQPYHGKLASACRTLFPKEYDVDDQVSGVYDALGLMTSGHPVSCVDLSSATDRFPRRITLALIRELGYPEFADALEEISSANWKCDFSPSGVVSYGCGQPMGAYGSFPAFTLTNLCLSEVATRIARARSLEDGIQDILLNKHSEEPLVSFPSGAYYHITGDDSIFPDQRITTVYREQLQILGVKTSNEKCFDGGQVAEYVGFILVNGDHPTAFRPYKVPSEDWVTNPLDFVHAIGSKVDQAPKRKAFWARAFRAYVATATSRDLALTPLSPDTEQWATSNRANASDLVSMSRHLGYALSESMNESEIDKALPCLSGDSRINRRPLMDERRPDEMWRFNPATFAPARDDRPKDKHRETRRRLSQDPLITEYVEREKSLAEFVPSIRKMPIPREDKGIPTLDSEPLAQVFDETSLPDVKAIIQDVVQETMSTWGSEDTDTPSISVSNDPTCLNTDLGSTELATEKSCSLPSLPPNGELLSRGGQTVPSQHDRLQQRLQSMQMDISQSPPDEELEY